MRITFKRPAVLSLALALVMTGYGSNRASGQVVPKSKDAKPVPLDVRPLARYFPKENLVVLIESNGLDANPEAWQKTAAYKLLNDTSLGKMLEAMVSQLAERGLTYVPGAKLNGADVVAIIKHAAKQGFAVGVIGDEKGAKPTTHLAVVFRGGYSSRENRPTFARLMGTLMGANKAQSIKRGGRTVVQVTTTARAASSVIPDLSPVWVWWPEGGDIVAGFAQPEDADVIMAVVDGKTPNAVDHPVRADLMKEVNGFTPLGMIFIDPTSTLKSKPDLITRLEQYASQTGISRFDYRWGFQDDALMTLTRLKAPKPRKGLLALFDQPSFDRSKLPPVPESLESFAAFSVDAGKALDAILPAIPKLPAMGKVADQLSEIEGKSRIKIREDLLARMGPKMAAYLMPGATVAHTPTDAQTKSAANPLGSMMGLPIPGLGTAVFPRYTLVGEVKDVEGFNKALDSLMVVLNKEMKTRAADAAKAAEDAENQPGAPGVTGGGNRRPGGNGGRRTLASAPEFKLMPGDEKVYSLTMPPEQVKQFPSGFRPTIRVNTKYVVIAATPDAARLALEAKAGEWVAPTDIAAAIDRLPKELIYFAVHDPRADQPELLASLPGTLQKVITAAMTPAAAPAQPGMSPGGMPGYPGMAMGGEEKRRGGPGGGGRTIQGAAPAGGGPGGPGGMVGMRPPGTGGPGDSGPGAKDKDEKATPFVFNIDSDLLPSADDIKTQLFPALLAVSADDQEILIQRRIAFPDPVSQASLIGMSIGIPLGKVAGQGLPPGQGLPGGPPTAGAPGRPPGTGGGGASRAEQ